MRVAVLCPGPSLTQTFSDDKVYDVRIGVNRAVEAFRCDYWAALDAETFGITQPIGRPPWFCPRHVHHNIGLQNADARDYPCMPTEDIKTPRMPLQWHAYTFPAALILAMELGATEVDIYGNDAAGTLDYDGKTFPKQRRSNERWQRENKFVDGVIKHMRDKGVVVNRILP